MTIQEAEQIVTDACIKADNPNLSLEEAKWKEFDASHHNCILYSPISFLEDEEITVDEENYIRKTPNTVCVAKTGVNYIIKGLPITLPRIMRALGDGVIYYEESIFMGHRAFEDYIELCEWKSKNSNNLDAVLGDQSEETKVKLAELLKTK